MELVMKAIEATISNPAQGEEYFERKHGSAILVDGIAYRSSAAALQILNSVEFVEVTDELDDAQRSPVARYFRFQLPEGVVAMQAVTSLGDLTDEELATVRVQRAYHQDAAKNRIEFISDVIAEKEVDYGHIIVGPTKIDDEEVEVVWTWHPGDVSAFLDTRLCTVKLQG
jgi:hypothetical protein